MQQLFTYIASLCSMQPDSEHALATICREVTFKKGSTIQDIGHTCKTLYFVSSGLVRIFYYKDEHDITESFEFENSFVARAESLFTGKPSKKGIQAIETSKLIAIDTQKLFALFDQFPDLERVFRKIIESAYVNSIQRLEQIQFHSAEERYKLLMKQAPTILQRVPLKFVASYLGITQVSLSRIRASL